jgi:hypothetical protein
VNGHVQGNGSGRTNVIVAGDLSCRFILQRRDCSESILPAAAPWVTVGFKSGYTRSGWVYLTQSASSTLPLVMDAAGNNDCGS